SRLSAALAGPEARVLDGPPRAPRPARLAERGSGERRPCGVVDGHLVVLAIVSSRQTHPASSRAGPSRRTTGFLAAAAALWAAVGPISGHFAEAATAPTYDALRAEVPQLLAPLDAAHYRAVFRLQEQGRWVEADARIAEIYDPLLLGHVLHQRYLHPTAYKSSYEELRNWLETYGDHPGAQRVYQLAQQRRPPAAPEPRAPFFTFEGARAEPQASAPG